MPVTHKVQILRLILSQAAIASPRCGRFTFKQINVWSLQIFRDKRNYFTYSSFFRCVQLVLPSCVLSRTNNVHKIRIMWMTTWSMCDRIKCVCVIFLWLINNKTKLIEKRVEQIRKETLDIIIMCIYLLIENSQTTKHKTEQKIVYHLSMFAKHFPFKAHVHVLLLKRKA